MSGTRAAPVAHRSEAAGRTRSMAAVIVHTIGEPMRLVRIPLPRLEPGHALLRIEASGVNPLDTKIRVGAADHARTTVPAVLGIDVAATVEAVGEGVTAYGPGDRVYGMTGGVGGVPGSLAEYAVVDVRLLAARPAAWTARQAAAVPLAAISSWEGLVDRADVQRGDRVLIHGGAGGVGHIAIQIATARGADVYATGSAESSPVLRGLGATPIDHRASTARDDVDRHTAGEGFDVILDTVGGATLDAAFGSVRLHTGRVVSILGWGPHDLAPLSFRGASYSGVFSLLPLLTGQGRQHHGDILREITALADAGALTPIVDPRTFTLRTATEAHRAVEDGSARGKIVVDVP